MLRTLLRGAAAGAVGTAALNATTYGDMLLRGRPPSDTPQQVVTRLKEKVHLPLPAGTEGKEGNRREGLGALLGYVVGIGIGVAYAPLRERLPDGAAWVTGFGVGAAAMLASDTPAVALGVTHPKDWDRGAWWSDIIPHLVYGIATVAAYEALRG